MGRVIMEDDVTDFPGGNLGIDGVEEADKLLMPVALHIAADDGAVERGECGEQGRGAVPLVIVGHRSDPTLLYGQARLGAVELPPESKSVVASYAPASDLRAPTTRAPSFAANGFR